VAELELRRSTAEDRVMPTVPRRPAAQQQRERLQARRLRAGELWTLDRIGVVIERLTGVRHHPAHVWALLRYRLGWTVQRPKRRAAERDQDAIDRWVACDWPRIQQTPNGAEPVWSSSTKARSA